jgi:dihydropteroate synthase
MDRDYFVPVSQLPQFQTQGSVPIAGSVSRFDTVCQLSRTDAPAYLPISDISADVLEKLSAQRAPIAGVTLDHPRIMGVLNVTPDSFSDGGKFDALLLAIQQAGLMEQCGADIIDIGGESTRPGAELVEAEVEIARVVPVVEALVSKNSTIKISVDTRKSSVATSALSAGAAIINDVSSFSFDPSMLATIAATKAPICLMHAQGDPKTMQKNPTYNNVVLDVYDYLEARVNLCVEAGIPKSRILVDPGIGFGKTLQHNLALLRHIGIFHGLGCGVLLGVSRKRFIGIIGKAAQADTRLPGSIAVALEALRHGVQVLRVHDVAETSQAISLWRSLNDVDFAQEFS